MPSARIKYLVERYFDNTCTPDERLELARWISEEASEDMLGEALGASWESYAPQLGMPDEMSDRIVASLFGTAPAAKAVPQRRI